MKQAIKALLFVFVLWGGAFISDAYAAGATLDNPLDLVVSGKYVYIASGKSNALEIIDVSDPIHPTHISSLPLIFSPSSLALYENYVYLTIPLANAVEIVDVTDPYNPFEAKTIYHGENGIDLRRPNQILTNNNFAFILSSSGQNVEIWDISDALNPVKVTYFSEGSLAVPIQMAISENKLFVTFRCLCNGPDWVTVSDIYNIAPYPSQLSKIGIWTAEMHENIKSIFIEGNKLYLTQYNGPLNVLKIFNINDSGSVTLLGSNTIGEGGFIPYSIFVANNYLYMIGYGEDTFKIINVSNPENPVIESEFSGIIPATDSPLAIKVENNIAYITVYYTKALDIIDVSNPKSPFLISSIKDGETVGTPTVPPEPTKNPVLIVPGVLGTEIFNGSEKLWLDIPKNIFSDDSFMDPLQFGINLQPIDDTLIISKVIDKVSTFFNYTESLINEFTQQGYVKDTNLFTFPYDWRYGLSNNIEVLFQQKIQEIKTQTGSEKVDIVAHSTGGLIVKKYVMDNPTTHFINKAVFVGVPNYGAPKAIKALLEGENFGVLGLSDEEMKKIAANLPVVYDLAPSQQYYNEKGSYVKIINHDSSSTIEKDLNYSETNTFLGIDHGLNKQAITNSTNLHSLAFDNFDLRSAGVDLYGISGCKAGTIGKITEERSNSGGNISLIYNLESTLGDGTVPLESSTNLPMDQTHKYYSLSGKHSTMLTQNGSRQQIVNIVTGSNLPTNGKISQNISDCHLNGKAVSIHSPLDLEITDQDGNYAKRENGGITNTIPNADFELMGEEKFVYLPTDEGQTYIIKLVGTGTGTFTLVSKDIVNNEEKNPETFSEIPVTTALKGSLDISGPQTKLNLDINGDGTQDVQIKGVDNGTVTMPYNFSGFLQPINDTAHQKDQNLSVFKAGSTVPVKFQLKKYDGTIVKAAADPIWLTPVPGNTMSSAIDETVYTIAGTSGNLFKWDPLAQQYIYNWSTKGLTPGFWYKISVKLDDGNIYLVTIGLK